MAASVGWNRAPSVYYCDDSIRDQLDNSANMDPTYFQTGVPALKPFRPEKSEDWEPYREIITALYAEMTLNQVMEKMETDYNFSGTKKQYKTRISEWGLTTKYIKKDEYEELLTKEEQHEYDVRGKKVTSSDLARFKRRQVKISEEKKNPKSRSRKKGQSSGQGIDLEYFDNAGEGSSSSAGFVMPTTTATPIAGSVVPQNFVNYPVPTDGSVPFPPEVMGFGAAGFYDQNAAFASQGNIQGMGYHPVNGFDPNQTPGNNSSNSPGQGHWGYQ